MNPAVNPTAASAPLGGTGLTIHRLDPLTGAPAARARWETYWVLANAEEVRVGGELATTRHPDEEREYRRGTRTAVWSYLVEGAGGPVAIGSLFLNLRDPGFPVGIEIIVDPVHRRRGIGRALLAHLDAECADWPETKRSTQVWARAGGHEAGMRFAAEAGYSAYQQVKCQVLPLPPTPEFQAAAASCVTPGYRIETVVGKPPRQWWDGLAVLREAMALDAPPGERDAIPETWDAARVEDQFERYASFGWTVVTAVALHEGTGEVAGYTESNWGPGIPHVLHQGDTLVLRDHRGHGLGRAMKLAAITHLAGLCPEAKVHRTSNAAENVPMLRVNAELGYVPELEGYFLQRG